jgi:alpha-glucosidase
VSIMLVPLFFFVLAKCNWASAAPTLRSSPLLRRDDIPQVAAPADCPGYEASNIVKTDSSLTADLTLAGAACNAYSEDLTNLKLVVEYQTGKLPIELL